MKLQAQQKVTSAFSITFGISYGIDFDFFYKHTKPWQK